MTVSRKEEMAGRITAEINRLPPVPAVVVDLRRVMAHPDVNYSDVLPLLCRDPGLSADLLKFVNSARFGVGHKVATLEEAIIYFGMTNLLNLVNSVFVDRVIMGAFSSLKGLERYVSHSRSISDACSIIADCAGVDRVRKQSLTLVGLIHDIGRLVLTIASDQKMLPLMGVGVEKFTHVAESEKELWGIDHCEVGAMICLNWNFPEDFIRGIRLHHSRPDKDDICHNAVFIYASHILTTPGLSMEIVEKSLSVPVWESMGLLKDRLNDAVQRVAVCAL